MAHLLVIRNGMMTNQAKVIYKQLNKIHGLVFYLLLAGFFMPTLFDLLHGPWGSEKNAHGPMVLIVSIVFFGIKYKQTAQSKLLVLQPDHLKAWLLILTGLLFYIFGRSQFIFQFEVSAFIVILFGCFLLTHSWKSSHTMWFAFFFMLFMVPLPVTFVDMVTMPMKMAVSWASQTVLFKLGYPIARDGVVLSIGPYQLLVADACAGLNSLFTLEAMGLLYLNINQHQSLMRNTVLGVLIVPISFVANVLRVIVLVLITYYFGDAAGQSYLHGFAGIVLFVSALLIIMGVDSLIQRWVGKTVRTEVKDKAATPSLQERQVVASVVLAGCFVAAYLLASYLQPLVNHAGEVPQFEKLLPERFAQWQSVPGLVPQVDLSTNTEAGNDYDKPYDAVLMRSYKDKSGHVVMLAIAYAMQQTQEIKIHRPEYCYHAQGFTIAQQVPVSLARGKQQLTGNGLLVRRNGRNEWVQYWIRIGSGFPRTGMDARLQLLKESMQGQVPDGILIRVSSLIHDDADIPQQTAVQQKFLQDMLRSVVGNDLRVLLGSREVTSPLNNNN